MRIWSRNTGRAALVAASALAVGAAFTTAVPAIAAEGAYDVRIVDMESTGNLGLLNGNQVFAPISMPVNVCGNALAIGGVARAKCKGGAFIKEVDRKHGREHGQGHGHGHGHKECQEHCDKHGHGHKRCDKHGYEHGHKHCDKHGYGHKHGDGGGDVRIVKMVTADNFGLLNGNQVFAPISMPVNVCGNALSLFGFAEAECKGGAGIIKEHGHEEHGHHEHGHKGHGHKGHPHCCPAPKKKPCKHKHRPAGKHEKLPSTLRAEGSRMANAAPNQRSAAPVPALKRLLNRITGVAKLPGTEAKPGQTGSPAPAGNDAPAGLGSPLLH
jgi:hypothetical protein